MEEKKQYRVAIDEIRKSLPPDMLKTLKDELIKEGFDLTRPIRWYQNPVTGTYIIFRQDEEDK